MIRRATEFDREKVDSLLVSSDYPKTPVGGYGLVYEKDGVVVGHIWALVNHDCDTAYIDFFIIDKELRAMGLGLLLITKLFADLKGMGIKRIIGNVIDAGPTTVARVYHRAGMKMAPAFVLTGDLDKIIEGTAKIGG